MSNLICPECKGLLVPIDDKTARCTVHGGEYSMLFLGGGRPVPAGSEAEGTAILADLQTPASTTGDVAVAAVDTVAATEESRLSAITPFCLRHPQIPAVGSCAKCGAPVCGTCDFQVSASTPSDPSSLSLQERGLLIYHVCPQCAVSGGQELSGKRKKYLIASYVLGVVTLLMFVFMLWEGAAAATSQTDKDREATNILLGNLVLWPSVAGTVLGVMSLDKRLGNTSAAWGAAIWNGVMLGVFLMLALVGTFMK